MVTLTTLVSPTEEQAVAPAEKRMLLHHVSWETYESLLDDYRDSSVPRFAYDRGVLEIVSPTPRHEEDGSTLAAVVEVIAEEFDLDIRSMRSTTYRRQSRQQGFEADASFYIQTTRFSRDMEPVDPKVDPPPDLVIEIEVTNPLLDKLPIYAGMGVPEVWRCKAGHVTILVLKGDAFREMPMSLAIPALTSAMLTDFLTRRRSLRWPSWVRMVRGWARAQRAAEA